MHALSVTAYMPYHMWLVDLIGVLCSVLQCVSVCYSVLQCVPTALSFYIHALHVSCIHALSYCAGRKITYMCAAKNIVSVPNAK